MKLSKASLDRLKILEGFSAKPYLCQGRVATIGFGTTRYPNGQRVKLTDKPITKSEAEGYLLHDLFQVEKDVTTLANGIVLPQHRFDAIVLFTYNLGSDIDADNIPEGLGDSNLLKKVLRNQDDPSIKNEFMKWVYASGKISSGLKKRRKIEANLYFNIL